MVTVLTNFLTVLVLLNGCALANGAGQKRFDREKSLTENRLVLRNASSDTIVSCYYSYGDAIDPSLCTHLLVWGANVSSDGTVSFLNPTICKVLTGLKLKNPNLKISVQAVGNITDAIRDETKRNIFVDQVVDFLRKSNFDGFDLDWEINNMLPVSPNYKAMTEFFRILRSKVQNEPRKIVLTAAVFAAPLPSISWSYNVSALNEYLDFINLMTYDFYQYLPTQPYTGHNSALFKRPDDLWIFGRMNTAWSALNWYKNGMDHKKIAVGIPTYGHTYKLLFRWWHGVRAPALGYGTLGRFVSYDQVCNLLANASYTRVFDNHAKVPYCYKDNQWISYEDEESATEKAVWIKEQGFNAMLWDFHSDDPLGQCDGKTTFPLHRKVWSILKA